MKLIGSVLIIFASIIASYLYEKKLKASIQATEELYHYVLFIKNKIEYFSMPINEIKKSYPCPNIISNNVEFLDKESKNTMDNFLSKLGKGFKKEQLALCEYTLRTLEQSRDKAKMEFTKKTKVFRSLSLFTGIGCVILLI